MKRGGQPAFYAKEVTKQWSELRGEQEASVHHDWVEQTMMTYYYIDYNLSKA